MVYERLTVAAGQAWIVLMCAAFLGLRSGNAYAAPITFNTALPVSQEEFILRELVTVGKASDNFGGLGRELTVVTATTVMAYGVTSKLALFGVVPVTFKELQTQEGKRNANGIGDARLVARFTVYKKDAVGKTYRIAPFIGVKAPTGDDTRTDELGLLPASLQPGTGSWDVFGGLIATYASVDWNLDLQASYRANTRSGDFERGDVARADASFQYRLLPGTLSRHDKGYVYGVLEANLVHSKRMRINGIQDLNTGGTTLYLVPGVQYATRRWIAEAAVQLPVIQDLNGSALERDFTVLAGLRVNF